MPPLTDQEPEIIILDSSEPQLTEVSCGVCSESLDHLTIEERQLHYDQHFKVDQASSSTNIFVPSGQKFRPDTNSLDGGKKALWQKRFPCSETDIFWYPAQSTPPPEGFIPGLIPLLRTALLKEHSRGLVRKAALCYNQAVHIPRQIWDSGWGCGYRNFLMACAALMTQDLQPHYFSLLDMSPSPSIRNLQVWIEEAWKSGYDEEGKEQLRRLVGTKKWVGTSDLSVAFTFRGIPTQLVDFELKGDIQPLLDWIVDYFTPKLIPKQPLNVLQALKKPSVVVTDKMPLILQHSGHSRTIVGYEVDKNGVIHLLAFDPAFLPHPTLRRQALLSSEAASTCNAGNGQPSGTKRKRSSDVLIVASTSRDNVPSSFSRQTKGDPLSKKGKPFSIGINEQGFDPSVVLKKFRLTISTLNKKKGYQILYFPMTAPLTPSERLKHKVVTSIKIER